MLTENFDLKDMIAALSNQRNGALDENAKLFAMLTMKDREIMELKERLKNERID